jgi:DNA-binding PadR family transcriptional regulator
MSIKQGLMALLAQEPMYGAQLRAEFEQRTGTTWPLNIGQVYTTLGRLERDGLVEATGHADGDARIAYRLTEQGRAEVARWWTTPVDRSEHPRNELAIKLALAVTLPGVDVRDVVQRQRTQTLRGLQDLTRLKQQASAADDTAWLLVLDHLVFSAEAEARWLDHVETRLARQATRAATRPPAAGDAEAAGEAPGSTQAGDAATEGARR